MQCHACCERHCLTHRMVVGRVHTQCSTRRISSTAGRSASATSRPSAAAGYPCKDTRASPSPTPAPSPTWTSQLSGPSPRATSSSLRAHGSRTCPWLEAIPGKLSLSRFGTNSAPAVYTNFTFPRLGSVGYTTSVTGNGYRNFVSGFSAPRLETVGLAWAKAEAAGDSRGSGDLFVGSLVFPTASASNTFALPAIKSVAGILTFQSNTDPASLTGVDMPELVSVVGRLYVYNSKRLTDIKLPKLRSVASLSVQSNYALTTFSPPSACPSSSPWKQPATASTSTRAPRWSPSSSCRSSR